MAGKTATLALKITGDATGGAKALDDTEGKAGRLSGVFGKLGTGIAAGAAVGGAALLALGKASFDAASDLQQSSGAIVSVFGDWSLDIEQAAQGANQALGLSTSSYENLAAVIGAQLHGAGMAHDEMSDKTQTLIQKGADLAATFGGTTADAVEALGGVLKGEFDPIERYGVSIKQSDVNARLAALGQDKLTGSALKTATANAALALITEQTSSSTGAFARESDTAAGAQQRLSATWENAKAALGERLLPVVATAATWLTGVLGPATAALTDQNGVLAQAFGVVSDFVTGQLIPAVMGLWNELAPKLLPILATVGGVITGTLVPAFQAVWAIVQNYVFPIIGSILTPALGALKGAWDKIAQALEDNRGKFQAIYENVQPFLAFLRDQVAPFIGGVLAVAFNVLGTAISGAITFFSSLFDIASKVVGIVGKVGGFIGGLFGAPALPGAGGAPLAGGARLMGATSGGLFGAAGSLGGGGSGPSTAAAGLTVVPAGDTWHITINGVLDADDAAAKIERLLTRRARMTGRQLAAAL